jgi:two-component system, OmpR family, osmolarity sensor histidine kinase EnvZ
MKVTSYIYNLLPRSLTMRFLLIIAVPTIIAQVIAIYIFYDRHWSNIFISTSNMVAKEIRLLIDIAQKSDIKEASREAKFLGIKMTHIPGKNNIDITKTHDSLYTLAQVLEKNLKRKARATLINNDAEIQILVQSDDGVLRFVRSAKPLINPTTYVFAVWMIALTFILLTVSLIFSRNQIRSILELVDAVDSFGGAKHSIKYYKPSGALEIRKAGIAFLRMKERIERYVSKRTQMLAMISHDLKTPLTRLTLQLEMMEDSDEVSEMRRDVVNMKQMISSYLDFARGEGGEEFKKCNILDWFKESMTIASYSKLDIAYAQHSANSQIFIKPLTFKRAIENILSNANKYATKALITISIVEEKIVIDIEDNGTGISDEEKHNVFKPFYRSDSSRHIDGEGSVGLGLSITKEIVLGHNGDIELQDSLLLGGLKVRIILPIS